MITIKKALESEVKILSKYYQDCMSFEYNSSCSEYIAAFDGNAPLGFCKIRFLQNKLPEIIALYVNENEREQGLGDGILRAAINYIHSKGYLYVAILGNESLNDFYVSEGLTLMKDAPESHNYENSFDRYNQSNTFYCNIPSFFQKGCKKM